MHQRETVVGGVHRVHTAFLHNKVTEALFSLLKVSLLSRLNVFKVDFDIAVPEENCLSYCMQMFKYLKENAPVRPRMLVDKAQSVHHLMNCSHHPVIEAAAEMKQNHL